MKLRDFRSINLVTSLYKIIAKVLFLRLREVLEFTISNEQAVFLKLRKTLDVILIDNEVVEYRRNNREALVSKIDFEKTYNHVG